MPAPPKKRTKTSQVPERPALPDVSPLSSDSRTSWLVMRPDQGIELTAKGVTIQVHREVLTKHSGYFDRCLDGPWTEAQQRSFLFNDIEPKYLALFVGAAYSKSSLVGMQSPLEMTASDPNRTPLRDFIEVYKLCDRFACPQMADYMTRCVRAAIGDSHRALFETSLDEALQKDLMREFADGYEALDMDQEVQKVMGELMIEYFCGGVNYQAWADNQPTVEDRTRFVASVSRCFAKRLEELTASKRAKRKLLAAL